MKLLFAQLIMFFFLACKVAEDLSLNRLDNNQLREKLRTCLKVDGYYFVPNQNGYVCFFLFENGVYRSTGLIPQVDSENKLHTKIKNMFPNSFRRHWSWGIYKIEGSKIEINRWLPGVGGPYPAQLLKGEIINERTIVIAGLTENGTTNRTDTFRFRKFSPKPDSTTQFIEGS
ncbi:MAG: hypothetical protein GVX96_05825 [Bacteroidetes bacterium]|jgi:hypothetical protein|nr:hypothetical protein [Bacteroidota bacterium]